MAQVVLLTRPPTLRCRIWWWGQSQQALGDYANVAKATIQRIEHGQSAPSLDVVVSLADALGLSIAELLTPAEP